MKKATLKDWNHYKIALEANNKQHFGSQSDKRKRIEQSKTDYNFFVQTYFPKAAQCECAPFHIDFANYVLQHPECKAAAIWARGLAKSTHCDIFIPLWLAILDELHFMVLIGKKEKDAQGLLSDLRRQFSAESDTANLLYINDFNVDLLESNECDFKIRLKTANQSLNQINFHCQSINQEPHGLRKDGRRPDYIVIDDCDKKQYMRNSDLAKRAYEWIFGELYGCFDARKEGVIRRLLFCNNLFVTSGLTERIEQTEDFYISKINALQPPKTQIISEWKYDGWDCSWSQKYQPEFFKKIYLSAPQSFEEQYMNLPNKSGKTFALSWIQWKPMQLSDYKTIICYVDPSLGYDFTACKVWSFIKNTSTEYHLLDCYVRQSPIVEAINWLYSFRKRCPNAIFYIEEAFYFKGGSKESRSFPAALFFDEIKRIGKELGLPELIIIKDRRRKGNKKDRINATSILYERKRIFYNKNLSDSPDFKEAIVQLTDFPNRNDDSPDADEGAFFILKNRIISDNPNTNQLFSTKHFKY